MMEYDIFKEVVAQKLQIYMPEEYRDMKLHMQEVTKVNNVRDGITLFDKEANNSISPTIYVDDIYEKYQRSGDLRGTLEDAAKAMVEAMNNKYSLKEKLDFDNAKENIIFQLINTEQNREMLDTMPHREMQDLSIIYRWVVDADIDGMASAVVSHSLADKIGMSEEELYQAAVVNTPRIMPPTIKSMNEVIRDIFTKEGMPKEVVDTLIDEMPADRQMWVISNEKGINGAASMLFEGELQELAERLDTDLYILPSSIHETIAISADAGDPYELAQMVEEINMNQVTLEERLSNQVYHYDKDLRELTLATDTPNKRLDGMAVDSKELVCGRER